MDQSRATAGLLGVALLAFVLRALQFPLVFPGDQEVIFALGDAYYHARRALFGFENFPAVLLFDPYLNFPHGAKVPFPPLYDFLVAAVARATGDSPVAFERVAAWLPALLGTLTTLPVYLAGRLLGGRGVGLGAAALVAIFPTAVAYSAVGNADHHAAVACLGATLLWLYLEACREDASRRRRNAIFAALVAARLAVLLSWNGSLLYLALGEAILSVALLIRGERATLFAASVSALATALAAAPWVAWLGTPNDGPYSAVEASRLHVLLFGGEALVIAVFLALDAWRPAASAAARAARALGVASAVGAGLLALPELRAGFGLAATWLAKGNPWGAHNVEQVPLFGAAHFRAASKFGYFAYLIPAAPIACLLRARRAPLRSPALFLAAWTLVLGILTLVQVRYGNDFAPAAAVAFSLLLAEGAALVRRRSRVSKGWAAAAATGVGAALLLPALVGVHLPKAVGSLGLLRGPDRDAVLPRPIGSLVRFAQMVRAATPESPGFLDRGGRPEYGVLCGPNIGHVMRYVARRAVPADNFGPYVGAETFDLATGFFGLGSEAEAVAVTERLRTPYVVTMHYSRPEPGSVAARLHGADGIAGPGTPRFERFRLVTEGPPGGVSLAEIFGVKAPRDLPPYKLFEVVEGAVLEATAEPGTPVVAQVTIATPTRRRFVYRAETEAGPDGVARLRVPYATRTELPARPLAPYRVRVGPAAYAVSVSDEDVRRGAVLPVGESPR